MAAKASPGNPDSPSLSSAYIAKARTSGFC
jgi:hypothetical protein